MRCALTGETETGFTITELREKGQVIEHKHNGPIEIWAGLGKKCKYCECFTMNSVDYKSHEGTHLDYRQAKWYPSSSGDGSHYTPTDKLPLIAEIIRHSGQYEKDGFVFTISQNGKWILRRTPFRG